MKEIQLYPPIKEHFEELGYEVYSEANNIDVVCKKDETLILIELKANLNFKLIYQGIERQKLSDNVYLAIKKAKNTDISNDLFSQKLEILKRLGLGLLIVDFDYDKPFVLISLEPELKNIKLIQSKNKPHLHSLLKEINSRSGDYNKGGTKGKTITAYKEKSLQIANFIKNEEPYSAKEIEKELGLKKVNPILYRNHYKWFEKVSHGKYKITKKGIEALSEFDYIVEHFGGGK